MPLIIKFEWEREGTNQASSIKNATSKTTQFAVPGLTNSAWQNIAKAKSVCFVLKQDIFLGQSGKF